MSKSRNGGLQWIATHRYADVYECDNGAGITLPHSIKGLQAAKARLESDGSDAAVAQLKHVDAKLEAIAQVPPPANIDGDEVPDDVEPEAVEE